jgi:type II secretory pathway component PulK
MAAQARDFSKLMHSSLIDTEMLARPTIVSEGRKESALKYMGLWGTTQVNINSAPRHVLEAAFAFGGDADKIADEIIKARRQRPFSDIEDLKRRLFRYSDSIEKCRPYITTASNIFSIHVTAVSGSAKASAVIVVFKEGGKIQRIAVVCG